MVFLLYIYMDTTTDHFTPLALCVRGNDKRTLGEKFWYISVIQSWHNVGKSGRDFKKLGGRRCTFSMGNYFPHDIIIFQTRL